MKNKTTIKAKYVERVRQHQIADELIRGFGYWQDGKGCAIGCTLELPEGQHDRYETELGLPEWLAHLEDHLFETLSSAESAARSEATVKKNWLIAALKNLKP